MEIVMQFGSVCSGIEAASVAWHPIGWKAAWLAEIEPFPCAVLAHHYPSVPNLGDMTTIARRVLTEEVPAPDVFCGGTPCQAFSVAGLRESLADERGNLTLKFVEIADAIDHVRVGRGEDECIVFWENVPGVLSTKDNAFGCFLGGLAGEDGPLEPPGGKWANAGAVYGPKRTVAWRVLDAQYFALAQRRRRVFVVASARKGFDPAQVLFEWDGVRRDSAPSREAREGTSRGVEIGPGGGRFTDLNPTLDTRAKDGPIRNQLAGAVLQHTTHSLRSEGFDASGDGTGRGTPLVPMFLHTNKGRPDGRRSAHTEMVSVKDIVETLTTDGHAQSAVAVPVAYGIRTANTSANGHGISPELAHTLDRAQGQCVAFDTTQITSAANYSSHKPGDPCHPLAAGAHPPAIAFPANLSGTQHASTENLAPSLGAANPVGVFYAGQGAKAGSIAYSADVAPTLKASDSGTNRVPSAHIGMRVRRLTPTEAERLMGFSDDYTAIPWRKKPASECPDGPRYRALGNSWAIPCVSWIGERIARQINSSTNQPAPSGLF